MCALLPLPPDDPRDLLRFWEEGRRRQKERTINALVWALGLVLALCALILAPDASAALTAGAIGGGVSAALLHSPWDRRGKLTSYDLWELAHPVIARLIAFLAGFVCVLGIYGAYLVVVGVFF